MKSPLLQAVIDALAEPAFVVTRGIIALSNAPARELFGEGIEGQDIRLAIRQPSAVERLMGKAEGEPVTLDLIGIGEADRRWVMNIAPMEDGFFVRLTDRSEAYAAERMRVDFVANASHELRTPLANLIGYTETIREEGADLQPELRDRFLGIVHDEAKRMQRIVEDLISLSRIEAERFSAISDEVVLLPLIEVSRGNNHVMASERGSEITILGDLDLPPVVGEGSQLLQVFDNLISNALRYGRPGAAVTVTVERSGTMARVAVQDEGEGIPAEHIPRLTERFYRVDASRSRALGGTGLGLSIVKHIVERHRGRLTIRSKVGEGTTVELLLPLARS